MAKGRNVPPRPDVMPLHVIIPWMAPANDEDWLASASMLMRAAWRYLAAIADRGMRQGKGLIHIVFEPSDGPAGALIGEADWVPLPDGPIPSQLGLVDHEHLILEVFYSGEPVALINARGEHPHAYYTEQLAAQGLHDRVGVVTALDLAIPGTSAA